MSKTYKVGYGKPPQASQFKKGQSGNPKGRQKGSRNLATLLDQELARPVMVTEAGKRKTYRKAELIVRMQVDKAANGTPPLAESILRKQAVYFLKPCSTRIERRVVTVTEISVASSRGLLTATRR